MLGLLYCINDNFMSHIYYNWGIIEGILKDKIEIRFLHNKNIKR